MKLCDAHLHLQDPRIIDNAQKILSDVKTLGLEKVSCCGISEVDWADVLRLAQAHQGVLPSFGLHPWLVTDRTPEWREALLTYLQQVPSGIGEIGLDHNKPHQALQEDVFLWQLELARELNVYVSMHCCNAWGRMVELLEDVGGHERGFILHSYSGGAELVKRLVPLGAHFSFSCTLMRPNNRRGPEALQMIPSDRLLIETDAPYLAPVRADGTKEEINHPSNIRKVLTTMAAIRKTSEEDLAAQMWINSSQLFRFEA